MFLLQGFHVLKRDADCGYGREKKPGLRVEYVHCSILMGYVEDILVNAVATHPELDLDTKTAVIRAVNKVRFPYSLTLAY